MDIGDIDAGIRRNIPQPSILVRMRGKPRCRSLQYAVTSRSLGFCRFCPAQVVLTKKQMLTIKKTLHLAGQQRLIKIKGRAGRYGFYC